MEKDDLAEVSKVIFSLSLFCCYSLELKEEAGLTVFITDDEVNQTNFRYRGTECSKIRGPLEDDLLFFCMFRLNT